MATVTRLAANDTAAAFAVSYPSLGSPVPPDAAILRASAIASCVSGALGLLVVAVMFPRAFPQRGGQQYLPSESAIRFMSVRCRLLLACGVILVVCGINGAVYFFRLAGAGDADLSPRPPWLLEYRVAFTATFPSFGPLFTWAVAQRCAVVVIQDRDARQTFLRVVFALCAAIYVAVTGGAAARTVDLATPLPGAPAGVWVNAAMVASWGIIPVFALPAITIAGSLWALWAGTSRRIAKIQGRRERRSAVARMPSAAAEAAAECKADLASRVRELVGDVVAAFRTSDTRQTLGASASLVSGSEGGAGSATSSPSSTGTATSGGGASTSSAATGTASTSHDTTTTALTRPSAPAAAAAGAIGANAFPDPSHRRRSSHAHALPHHGGYGGSSSHGGGGHASKRRKRKKHKSRSSSSSSVKYPLSLTFAMLTAVLVVEWTAFVLLAGVPTPWGVVRNTPLLELLSGLGCLTEASFERLMQYNNRRRRRRESSAGGAAAERHFGMTTVGVEAEVAGAGEKEVRDDAMPAAIVKTEQQVLVMVEAATIEATAIETTTTTAAEAASAASSALAAMNTSAMMSTSAVYLTAMRSPGELVADANAEVTSSVVT
ncbi:hypothetical protein H9P43_007039 [Blastocladiella emersonii ATCC 22665]|nr:hypothetical protein H9P43_007039 [Blastocladiella emersonii ATCC 22665]